VVNLQFTL